MKTTIQISTELKDFLESQAIKKAETYEEIIRRLLEKAWGTKIPVEKGNTNAIAK